MTSDTPRTKAYYEIYDSWMAYATKYPNMSPEQADQCPLECDPKEFAEKLERELAAAQFALEAERTLRQATEASLANVASELEAERKQNKLLQADVRTMQACWNAACHDLDKERKAREEAEIKYAELTQKAIKFQDRFDKLSEDLAQTQMERDTAAAMALEQAAEVCKERADVWRLSVAHRHSRGLTLDAYELEAKECEQAIRALSPTITEDARRTVEAMNALRTTKPNVRFIDLIAFKELMNVDCLSIQATVFRNSGTVDGVESVPVVELTAELQNFLQVLYSGQT